MSVTGLNIKLKKSNCNQAIDQVIVINRDFFYLLTALLIICFGVRVRPQPDCSVEFLIKKSNFHPADIKHVIYIKKGNHVITSDY